MQPKNDRAARVAPRSGSECVCAGNEIDREDSLRHHDPQAPRPVHIGSRHIGFVIPASAGFEAISRSGARLGRFNSELAAASALAARAMPSPDCGG
jgi:hypothetical protein